MAEKIKAAPKLAPFADGKFSMEANEVFVFAGPENMVIEQREGWIEARLRWPRRRRSRASAT
jgi:hypothetical protein